jgi:hypothetical protein
MEKYLVITYGMYCLLIASCVSRVEEPMDFYSRNIQTSYLTERIDPNTGEVISRYYQPSEERLVIEVVEDVLTENDLLTIYQNGQVVFQSRVASVIDSQFTCHFFEQNDFWRYEMDDGKPLYYVTYSEQENASVFMNFITDNGNSIVDCSLRTYFK